MAIPDIGAFEVQQKVTSVAGYGTYRKWLSRTLRRVTNDFVRIR